MAAAFAAVSNLRRQHSHTRITQLKTSHSQPELVRRRPPNMKFHFLPPSALPCRQLFLRVICQRCHAKGWCGVQVNRVVSLKAVDALQKGDNLLIPHLERNCLSRVSCFALERVSPLPPIGMFSDSHCAPFGTRGYHSSTDGIANIRSFVSVQIDHPYVLSPH